VAACPECNHWESELPGSPFATAAAVVALVLAESASSQAGIQDFESQLSKGQDWLVKQTNPDGGWGDAPGSPINAVATALCWAALAVNLPSEAKYSDAIAKADAWLRHNAGVPAPASAVPPVATAPPEADVAPTPVAPPDPLPDPNWPPLANDPPFAIMPPTPAPPPFAIALPVWKKPPKPGVPAVPRGAASKPVVVPCA